MPDSNKSDAKTSSIEQLNNNHAFEGSADNSHPTRSRLIRNTMDLLDKHRPEEITITMVIELSKVSKGAFYHHFREFEEIIEEALAARFVHDVATAIGDFTSLIGSAKSKEELITLLKLKTQWTDADDARAKVRLERIQTLGRIQNNERFRKIISAHQANLTNQIIGVIEDLKARGIVKGSVSSRVFATFVQAYSLGRVIDDISEEPVDKNEWNEFLNSTYQNYLFD
jgi:AcrR family transcriptional regulator